MFRIQQSMQAKLFANAREALNAALEIEAINETYIGYEIEPLMKYDGRNLTVSGFQVRCKDINGFGIGYIAEI
jgi:hypothetical protein